MLNIYQLNKTFGAENLLENVSFVVSAGEKVGLLGPNGCGKSTLLRIINGDESYDSGQVSVAPGTTIGYLPQGLTLDDSISVRSLIQAGRPEWDAARRKIQELTASFDDLNGVDLELAVEQFGWVLETFESLGGYGVEHQSVIVLQGLGLDESMLDTPVSALSGGQRTRVGLAKTLLAQPNLLLLDEPTNHLDIEALEWLESFLSNYPGSVLIVSHDRDFLDRTINRVIAIDPETHKTRSFAGNYSQYTETIRQELQRTWDQYRDQQVEIQRMEADIHRTRMHAQSVELTTTSRQPNVRRYAKKVAKKALSREKKLDRYRDSDERVEKPKKGWQINIDFDENLQSGQSVLTIHELAFAYPDSPQLLAGISFSVQFGERIALLGENGSGKSSLLKLIVGELEPASGVIRLGSSVRVGYMPQEQETLNPDESPLDVIRSVRPMTETDGRNYLHQFLFEGDAAVRPVSSLSYGERARLLLAKIISVGANFLVLDEPINHLDIPSRQRFEAALDAFPGTVLATTHDRAFIRNFAQKTFRITQGTIVTHYLIR